MPQPRILDLLSGGMSQAEIEHGGHPLNAFNVEVTEDGGKVELVPVLAEDSVDAIERAFELLFPDWDTNKPKSNMNIKVTAFDRRAA